MILRLVLGAFLSFSTFLFSCAPIHDSPNNLEFANKILKSAFPTQKNENFLDGVWMHQWQNMDGYPIYEFVKLDSKNHDSFTCVINPMGGYEISPASVHNDVVFTTFVDPLKTTYINQLKNYGTQTQDAELVYQRTTDKLVWEKSFVGSNRSNQFSRLFPMDSKNWQLYQSTCGQLLQNTQKVNLNNLKFEKFVGSSSNNFASVIQRSALSNQATNYCVYNKNKNTIVSLPVYQNNDNTLVFSNLDYLSQSDRSLYFAQIPSAEMLNTISAEMIAKCSAFSENARAHNVFPNNNTFKENKTSDFAQGVYTKTYLVCNYSHNQNGSAAGWEWGEYPRWEWEVPKQTCKGLFPSNCVSLNGNWARDDAGLKAIGTMFVVDSSSAIEADLNRACRETNQMSKKSDSRFYARYYVADTSLSLNHTLWFRKTNVPNYYNLPFERIVAFGDSLTDNGNLHNATAGLVVKGGYYQGHFTNGLVWAEHLSKKLGLDLYNWAVGAAPTALGNIFDMFRSLPYTLQNELINFKDAINEVGISKNEISRTLFTLLIGGNNFVYDVRATPQEIADDIEYFVQNLIDLGARHIMLINLPDVSTSPRFLNAANKHDLQKNILDLNNLLNSQVHKFEALYPQVSFYTVDLFTITENIINRPSDFSVSNTHEKCYYGSIMEGYNPGNVCQAPEHYVFWDDIHPSTSLHCQVSDYGINEIFEKYDIPPVPVVEIKNKFRMAKSIYGFNANELKTNRCAFSFIH